MKAKPQSVWDPCFTWISHLNKMWVKAGILNMWSPGQAAAICTFPGQKPSRTEARMQIERIQPPSSLSLNRFACLVVLNYAAVQNNLQQCFTLTERHQPFHLASESWPGYLIFLNCLSHHVKILMERLRFNLMQHGVLQLACANGAWSLGAEDPGT